ncbi:ABC transporter permease [Amorphus orientalis]|uniref:Peptide/nickel transport system permease protein/nickel transport system permease protein n=1 Tax=Amorphus orientalis TaxID=649198 RepID=A0AAE3VLB2_9HYPH|nr:ABC transporter permease subunit [Amorphus orientalis]MDQ0314092.1 peptide/nickel transport system permease protein/nickel transport system permease protein [Amorphus orientalis]
MAIVLRAGVALPRRRPALPRPISLAVGLGLFALLLVAAPLLAPHDPNLADILNRLAPPSWTYPLGTDALGRCLLSRLLYGARLTVSAACLVVVVAATIGTVIGLAAGYAGGWLDRLVMRLVEGVSILPALAVSLVIAGTLGLSLASVLVALTAVHWTEYARVVRNMTVVERAKPYVMAAHAIGAPGRTIVFRHLFPNVGGPLLVLGAYSLSWVILAFAGLSFLGLGVEPGTAEWGRMIAEARSHMRSYPRLVLAPGLSIMAFVVAVNLLGDALGDRWRVDQALALTPKKGRSA